MRAYYLLSVAVGLLALIAAALGDGGCLRVRSAMSGLLYTQTQTVRRVFSFYLNFQTKIEAFGESK